MQLTFSPAVAADTPFRLQVAPDEAVAHPGWRQARAAALAVLGRGEAAVLLGPPGTGKTLLLRDLTQVLRHQGQSVCLVERGDALDPALVADDVLLVDEAGRIGADALACLCATARPFLLAALPGFAERLDGLARPITRVVLEPLSPEAVARFVAARLSAAGRPRDMLEPDAIFALARHSAGLPRLVNVLGSAAVFLAELEQAPRVCERHVDQAASMRDGAEEATAASVPAGVAAACAEAPHVLLATCSGARATVATPFTDACLAPPIVPSAWWQRRATLGAAAAGLGLMLAGGWTVSGWWTAQAPGARTGDRGGISGGPHGQASDQRPAAQPRGPDRMAASSRDKASSPVPHEEQLLPRPAMETKPPLAAGTALRQQRAVHAVPVAFRGPVYNETLQQGGQMSLVVRRQEPSGAVTARFEAWGGLLGSGELTGYLSEDGRLRASGLLMVGKNPFVCDLSGLVAGDELTGSASFVRSRGGRVAHSRFTLTRL